jgi:hypothetical protein
MTTTPAHRTVTRVVARALLAHAARTLPLERAEWGRAMHAEVEHIASSRVALEWSVGCVLASYRQRVSHVMMGTLKVSRLVLGLEMLLCFSPLTMMFAALASLGTYGFAGPLPVDAWWVQMTSATLIGPIGLGITALYIVRGRLTRSVALTLLLTAPVLWTTVGFIALMVQSGHPGEHWGTFVLFVILPIAGAVHLLYLSERKSRQGVVVFEPGTR